MIGARFSDSSPGILRRFMLVALGLGSCFHDRVPARRNLLFTPTENQNLFRFSPGNVRKTLFRQLNALWRVIGLYKWITQSQASGVR